MGETSNSLSKQNSQQPKQFRGGEKKVMKKSLSLLVAICMVFSMFATVVSAAETEVTAGEYLNELGVIQGNQEGDLKEDQTWKRQDMVVLLSRLMGEEAEAEGTEKSHGFEDVTDAYYDGYISWAVEKGLVNGKSETKFGFGDELETRDFLALLIRVLNPEAKYEEVEEDAIAWGFATEDTDFDANALRGETYTGIVAALKTEVGENGETLEEILGLVEGPAVDAEQAGVKKISVKFNKPVDESKVEFAVKNGVSARDVVKATFSEDKKAAELELSSKLRAGNTTVTVTGVGSDDLVSEFTAEDEKVTEIKFTSDKLALGTVTGSQTNEADYSKVSVGYKIINQFEEDVTNTSGGSLTFQVGKSGVTASPSNGVLTLTSGGQTSNFFFGETVYVNAILNMSSYGVTASQTFTVDRQAMVDSVEILEVYNQDGKELMTNSTFPDFFVLVDAKDQYGNAVTLDQFKSGVFASVDNPMLFMIDKDQAVDGQGPNNDKIGIPLTAPQNGTLVFEGTNTVRVQTLFGGKVDTVEVPVKKAATLTTFTLEAPDKTVSAGQTVKIPFTAYDQNGEQLKKYSALNGKVTLNATAGTISMEQNYSTKEAYIEWTAPGAKGFVVLTSFVTGTPNNSQLQINVEDAGVAESVSKLDVNKTMMVDATVKVEPKHIIVKDQFGRDMKLADLLGTGGVYKAVVSAADGTANVVTGFGTLNVSGDSLTLVAADKGSERVKVELIKIGTGGAADKVVSTLENFTFKVVDSSAIDSYEVTAIDMISNKTANHNKTVEVKGKISNSESVTLPKSAYTVTVTAPLTYDQGSNKISATAATVAGSTYSWSNDGKLHGTFNVTILATGESIVNDITVTDEALVPKTFKQKDAGSLKAADGVVQGPSANVASLSDVFATVEVKDQFGVVMTAADLGQFTATVTNLDNVAGSDMVVNNNGGTVQTVTVANVQEGDSYSVVFISRSSGERYSVKVVANS
ncbi:S-layer homology domain-containing protein [Paenibacillus chungangensis]|uniref:S-layer homology domain-containing protein n=1 Tax=Paenibacillus chungangensis TaxID=696535 RepID=A0ABW3HK84_9BACL